MYCLMVKEKETIKIILLCSTNLLHLLYIILIEKIIARPFGETPVLYGENAVRFLKEMENIGEITAASIVGYFKDEEVQKELAELFALGVSPRFEESVKEGIFQGEQVVLTGSLTSFKRSEAQKLIEERGGTCQSSVTAKTTLVVAGEAAGSKLDKAKKLGIKIIGEEEFAALLEK